MYRPAEGKVGQAGRAVACVGGERRGGGVGMLAIERYLRTCESWFTRSSWLFSHTLILVLTHSNLILVDTLVLVHTLLVALAATVELERECHVHEDVADVHALLHLDAWGARRATRRTTMS